MWLALAVIAGLVFAEPKISIIFIKASILMFTNFGIILRKWIYLARLGISTQMIFDFVVLKIRILTMQKLGYGLLSLQDNSYNLTYYDGDCKYRIRFNKIRGVRQIVYVESIKDNKNITKDILELLGPSHNFHGIPTTSKLLGYPDGLKIQYRNGTSLSYNSDNIIQLNLT